ncbi:MAG: glucose-1-phosphate cytidylyltransferase [Halobacteriovoraceae bacterium]|nr:glucose-1-phosphate cytidylyltransferase [Halobacteriovoraceae bacterium]|tara:strand:- start:2448 stop:3164 length:717 start_codon:yes stop_codon:yes gene_type:complete
MKVVIFCGGLGTRLGEISEAIPKPMVKVGGEPLLIHIMKIFLSFGYRDFVLPLGYKSLYIKDYFDQKKLDQLGVNVELVETGESTGTAKRLTLIADNLKGEERFFVTYGDGVSNLDLTQLLNFHLEHKKLATMTVVHPPARFGQITIDKSAAITSFNEKAPLIDSWINGGFFVFEKDVFEYLSSEDQMLESEPLANLVKQKQIMGFRHEGFWQCMDTPRDKRFLEQCCREETLPWMKF